MAKFAPKISDSNLGKKNPNMAPEATERPSKKAKIKSNDFLSKMENFFI